MDRRPTTERERRIISAMHETEKTLAKLRQAYEIRPEHLRADEDLELIETYHNHYLALGEKLAEAIYGITRPDKCIHCGTYYADPPSKLCPGCEAYQEHTGI